MKASCSLEIYIASRFRNLPAVFLLRDVLRDLGHTVVDFTSKAPPLPDSMPLAERRAVLDSDERGHLFEFCADACGSVDLVVYLGPAGQDAACEVGMAYASGVPVCGVAGPLDIPGLILNRCVLRWFSEFGPFLDAVHDLQCKRDL